MLDSFPYLQVQQSPTIIISIIPGSWLLEHCTPTWRIVDPILGFQRMVSKERARAIAVAVLNQQRTFPNSIVLATNSRTATMHDGRIEFADDERFLIIDGQHRLYSQNFSSYDAPFTCVIHVGLPEKDMADLFLEINDNQKRVPSSLRWDLFRLTRPDDDPIGIRTSELVFDLASEKTSALYQRIDLTGENKAISLKQGSVAPAIKSLISSSKAALAELGYDVQLKILIDYVAALKECDTDGWTSSSSPFYGARVFRASLRLLGDIVKCSDNEPEALSAAYFFGHLKNIDLATLDSEEIKAKQGTAGIKEIYSTIRSQMSF